ncbi:hypothetical protein [Bacillus sp. EB600]|uniref:hypothetical protein n=1 Tax=Bacillus sp. EB600 TaxID=2806345 RepID=UPI00210A4854|nr:hypothetical protein [Bacillus sp. EB600]MCQ6278363.1 hypothetical protein [Bacillus sp. EB600]
MQRNRYILCLLVCGLMLYYAVPRLHLSAPGVEGIFASAWLLFALFVIAGNLTGILYYPKRQARRKNRPLSRNNRGKSRNYQ